MEHEDRIGKAAKSGNLVLAEADWLWRSPKLSGKWDLVA